MNTDFFADDKSGSIGRHAGLWNGTSNVIRTGFTGGPVVLFNLTQQGNGDTLFLSPFSRFMDTSLTQRNQTSCRALEYGVVGSMSTIPAAYEHSFIVFYSSQGINRAVRAWGEAMQRVYKRTNEHRVNDISLNYIGYYMDNGAYYFHNTIPGKNYQDTMLEIAQTIDLPLHYLEISAWFYYKGVKGGVSNWTARPDVFPDGIPELHRRLNYTPFIIHNRY